MQTRIQFPTLTVRFILHIRVVNPVRLFDKKHWHALITALLCVSAWISVGLQPVSAQITSETYVGTTTETGTSTMPNPGGCTPDPIVYTLTGSPADVTIQVTGSLVNPGSFTGTRTVGGWTITETVPTQICPSGVPNVPPFTVPGYSTQFPVAGSSSPISGTGGTGEPFSSVVSVPGGTVTTSSSITVAPVTGVVTLTITTHGIIVTGTDTEDTTYSQILTRTSYTNQTSVASEIYKAAGCQCSASDPDGGTDPIRLGVGNLYEEIPDYTTQGRNPLSFTRYYNSAADTNSVMVALGHNWRSTYDRYLRISAGSVVAERSDGQELTFTTNSGSWTSDSDVDVQLLQSGSTWTLIDSDDTVETYNSSGLLSSVVARDGYAQTMSYNSSNQLATVADSFNRKLQLAYHTNLLYTVTAPNGLVMTYGYNSSSVTPGKLDRLATVTYSTTPQTSQAYVYENSSYPFAMTGMIDEDGNRYVTWSYDSSGRANSSQHAGGAVLTTITYNADGSCSVVNALGLTQVYKFTTVQSIPKLTEVDRLATATTAAATMTYSYDANGYIANISDWNANLTSLVTDIHDQPLTNNQAVGTLQARTTAATYLANFHLPVQIVAPRKTTTFTYDGYGNPLTRTETDTSTGTVPYSTSGQTHIWTNTFDNLGHLLTSAGPRTDVLATNKYTYDGSNNLSAITDPLGHVTQITNYNGSGLPQTMIDANGVTNRFTYDIRDRLLTRVVLAASGNATNTFGYDSAGQLTSIILPDGSLLDYQYDAAHRLQSVSNSLGESITYTLDAAGNIIQQNTKNTGVSIVKSQSRVFDQLGRMLQDIGASSQTNTYAYDANGNQISFTDGLNNSTSQAFDALNRLSMVLDPLSNLTTSGYDAQDNLVSVTDPRSLVTSYVYNGFGQMIQESSPDKGTTVYKLDKAGNRTNEVDARGIVTQRTFDNLNRVTAETFPASSGENITFSYDATTSGYFGIGRLTSYTDESGSTTLTYNQRGDVISTTRTIGGQAYTTAYGYNIADNITNITYPSGHIITYSRDSQRRINSVTYRPSVAGTPTLLATNVTYMPFGPISGLLYGNGLARTNIYDKDYRLTAITTLAGITNIQNLGFAYNVANNIVAISDNLASARSQAFDYDPDYRLTQAVGLYGTDKYTYDSDGNRLTRTAGNVTETYHYSSTANQLQSTVKSGVTRNLSYALNGNAVSDNRGTATTLGFTYGNRNRYSTFTTAGSTTATYKYNALGERLIKTAGTATTDYHYNEKGHLIAESQSSGAVIREYVWLDDMPLAQIETSGTIYFIHPDHLNRPQKMTDVTRNIVWDNEQQPFGEAVPPTLTPAGYNASKQFQITFNAAPNNNYILQASTNLSTSLWVSLATNSTPFNFADAGSSSYRMRFYRGLFATNANIASVTNNLRLPGQYFDAESGLNYNLMRDYDPTLGRYAEADPIGLNGGINLYEYVFNNSLNGIDPFGLSCDSSPYSVATSDNTYGAYPALEKKTRWVPTAIGQGTWESYYQYANTAPGDPWPAIKIAMDWNPLIKTPWGAIQLIVTVHDYGNHEADDNQLFIAILGLVPGPFDKIVTGMGQLYDLDKMSRSSSSKNNKNPSQPAGGGGNQ
jgi:RHS repeat-associated protein